MFWGEQQAVVTFVAAACIFSGENVFSSVWNFRPEPGQSGIDVFTAARIQQATDIIAGCEAQGHRAIGFAFDELLNLGIGMIADFVRGPFGNDGAGPFPSSQHNDLGADSKGTGHIMSDNDGGHVEFSGEVEGELVNDGGHDGIKTGGGFVTEEQFGIECHRPRQTDPFTHASTDF